MATVVIPIPHQDFDPTEVAVPWKALTVAGHTVLFATPSGTRGRADQRVLTGAGFGPLRRLFAAERQGAACYAELEKDERFAHPLRYQDLETGTFDGLLLPGGHAPGMKEYLEAAEVQRLAARFFEADKPVGAICHGVLVLARATLARTGRSVLFERRSTALPAFMELPAVWGTRLWLGTYFQTYPETVQHSVSEALGQKERFEVGPLSLRRDSAQAPGFAVIDGRYVSARWPGDAHGFAARFREVLERARPAVG